MSGGGSSGSYGSGPSGSDCNIIVTVPLNSPKPSVVSGIKVDDVLNVELDSEGKTVLAKTTKGAIAGSLTPAELADLIDCLKKGVKYSATVVKRQGGTIHVEIRRR